jgi:hypothetical protein
LVRIVFSSGFICIANALAPGLVSSLEPNGLSGVLLHYAHRGIAVERDGYVAPASKGANFIDYCQPRGSFWAFRTQVLIAHR